MKNKCGIYKVTNHLNQVYVGASKNIVERYYKYKTVNFSFQTILLESVLLYGWENHTMEIIEECEESELNCKERQWQLFYNVLGEKGLNSKIEPCGEEKAILRDSLIKKLSDNKKGENHHYWGKRGVETPMFGKNHTEETKQKIREKNTGHICTEETRKILSEKNSGELNGFYGKTHTEKTKQKMSVNHADFSKGKHPMAKLVLDLETGIFYDCVEDASNVLGIKRGTLTSWLSGKRPNKSNFIYC
jgi:group I intron endonuclease